jgi:hypothetical protein
VTPPWFQSFVFESFSDGVTFPSPTSDSLDFALPFSTRDHVLSWSIVMGRLSPATTISGSTLLAGRRLSLSSVAPTPMIFGDERPLELLA